MVCFKAREQFHASTERKILCGGHCIKSIYPREKMKSLPGFESHHIYIYSGGNKFYMQDTGTPLY